MKVVITAGGKGTRIRSIAGEIPKAMIPVNGKPILEHQIALAKRYGFTDFLLLTGYLGNKIEDYFGNGSSWGVTIEYYQEKEPLGTAGAFAEVSDRLTSDFWVFYGDTVMDVDMVRMLDFHRVHHADATLFLHPNDHPFDSDLVEIAGDGRVSDFHPKPHEGYFRNLVNAALYIFSPSMLRHIPAGTKCDFGKEVFPQALALGTNLYGYVSAEYIKDMGTPDRYEKVCADVASGKVARLNSRNKRPAFFLDRDGVINREVDLLSSPEQMALLPGAAEAISRLNCAGYLAIAVTNQPVIARNLCSLHDLQHIHNKMETLLGEAHAYLDAIYFCPHHPDGGYPEERPEYKIACSCRKPKPGMLLQAAREWNIDMSASYMIGDRPADVQAGEAAQVKKSIMITSNTANALLEAVNTLLQ
ncbi:MAG: HAD-IIIA family hydrolase [Prevotellaceae bacterium]|jgi:D,D-heptose 1,7-bisphosphate phosphatase|nr:HAD-IIIA family hydrolase [Prevotellaceae bacterium]